MAYSAAIREVCLFRGTYKHRSWKDSRKAEKESTMKATIIKRLTSGANSKKGFTLVEVIVVLVILAILMAIAIPSLTGYIEKAKDQALKADGRTLSAAASVIASDLYTVDLSTAKPTKAQLAAASGATITGTATDPAALADWFKASNKLASSNLGGTLSAKFRSDNTLLAFAYTKDVTPTAASKWAYFDGTEWTVKVGIDSPVTDPTIP
jgi:type IV pilus assembly protein PilA